MFEWLAVALWSGAIRAGPGSGVSPAEGLGPQLGRPSPLFRFSAALLGVGVERQRPNRSDEPATISSPGLVLVDSARRLAIN